MEPLVSVIVPVYNVSPYLREALDSVIVQTYRNLEILVVDDGSTDGSGEICDEYTKDPRVQVIHQENRGLSSARNAGLDRMTGKCVAFLDSDDAFRPDMIQLMTEQIRQTQADLVCCGYHGYKTDGMMRSAKKIYSVIPEASTVLTSREAFQALAEGSFSVSAWNKLYTKKIWEHLRFPEGMVYEDIAIIPYVIRQCGRIAVIPEALVFHRKRKGSITSTYTIENTQDYLAAKKVFGEALEKISPLAPSTDLHFQREDMIRNLILYQAEIRKQGAPPEVAKLLDSEIRNLTRDTFRPKKIKTQVVWRMYRFCPGLLLPAQAGFRLLKRISRTEGKTIA